MHWTEIIERRSGHVVILELRGYLTLSDEDLRVMREVAAMLDAGERLFTLNLRHVSYVDSTGIGEIVGALTKVTRRGGRLNLCEASPRVTDVLIATNLNSVLETFGSEADAVAALS